MRNPVACVACRTAKRQCIHNDCPPCKRCKDRSEVCVFPSPGTSSIHRQSRLQRVGQRSRTPGRGSSSLSPRAQEVDSQIEARNTATPSRNLSAVNPFLLFTDEVKNSYLRCSYKWSFHHIPTLLIRAREGTLDSWVIWAILALAIRFSNTAPAPFDTPIEASNAFAAHARTILLPNIEQPTVSRIQALLMITGHSWGAGEGRRAWIHLGVAMRMAQVMGLFEETSASSSREDFILAEERRRTAWTCFLMDSLLSGGKGRRRTLGAEDMRIQLPCDSESFNFGEPVRCERLNGALSTSHTALPVGNLGIVAYSMRVAEIWGRVARWAGSAAVDEELPWQSQSGFQHLLTALDQWREALPERLRYSVFSLQAHSACEQGQAYAYMHSIYFMSVMFLHRSYLSSLPEVESRITPQLPPHLEQQWQDWRTNSRKELLQVADNVCEMLEEMRVFGLFFLRGLVPWIGFTAYTAVGIVLYYYHFPNSEDGSEFMKTARSRVLNGCAFLKDMRGSWPMADTWRETIKQMQTYYSNIKTKGENYPTPTERKNMRDAITDYGALQPSPVQDQAEVQDTSTVPASINTSEIPPVSASPPMQTEISTMFSMNQALQGPYPTDFDMFESNFSLDDVDLEAAVTDATQAFWANFPGEVEIF